METRLHRLRRILAHGRGSFQKMVLLLLGGLLLWANLLLANPPIERNISTKLGDYSFQILPPPLPELATIPLFQDSPYPLPKLPSWKEQARPTGFSLFSNPEDLYNEGLELLQQREWQESLAVFDELIAEFPESPFYLGAMFWKARLLIGLKTYGQAEAILLQVIATRQYSKYLLQSAQTFIWLMLRQGKAAEALEAIENYMRTIFTPKWLEGILPLKVYAHLQQQQEAEALETLQALQTQFPENPRYFENAIQMAELSYKLKQWEAVSSLIESVREKYKNQPRMEHLLYVGIASDLQSKNWKQAQQKLEWIDTKGIENQEAFAQSSFYLLLWQGELERARDGLEAFRTEALKNENLRQLFHEAFRHEKFQFLVSQPPDEKRMAQWQVEGFWMLAYAYEQLEESAKAAQMFQKALAFAQQEERREMFLFYRAALELQLNNFEQAKLRLQKMLKDYRKSPQKSEYAFWYAITQGQLGEALVPLILKQVKPPTSRMDDSRYSLQRHYHARQQWEEAQEQFLKLVAEYPETPFLLWAYYYQAEGLFQQKEYQEADETLQKWRKDHEETKLPDEMIELWAKILIELQDFQKALDLLDQAEKENQNFAQVQLRLKILKALGQHETILAFISELLKRSWNGEQKAFLHFARAESAYALEKTQLAIQYYREALTSNVQEDSRYFYYQLAKLTHTAEDYPEFLKMSENVLDGSQDERSNHILTLLSDYFRQISDKLQEQRTLKLLAQNYEKELAQEQPTPAARRALLFELAKVKKRLGLYQEADQLFDQTLAFESQSLPLDVIEEKGDTAFLNKQYKKAAATLLKVVYLKEPPQPEEKFDLLKKIAYSYEQIGQVEEAKAVYRKMLRDFKKSNHQKQIQENLKRLQNVSRETSG